MSNIEQARDDTGRFAGEEKFGRAAELEAAGYKEMLDAPQEEQKICSGDEDAIRAAADELSAGRDHEEPIAVEYRTDGGTGELIDEKEAVTVEKAARDLSAFHDNAGRYIDGVSSEAIADVIDTARAEALKANPKDADAYGLDPADVAAKARAVEEKAKQGDEPTAAEPSESAEPTADGLDPEVQKALKHPQVRQAIEEELGKAETTKQNFAQALNVANQYAQASLLDHFPELQDLPQDRWAEALGVLRQADPQRFERGMNILQRVDHLQQSQAQWHQHQANQQRQQFESYAKAEDARFEELTKSEPITKEVTDAVVKYAESLGVDRASLTHLMATNPVMRNAAFQRMMVDAARYQMVKAAVPRAAPKTIPPVQRPGAKQVRSTGSEDVGAWSARLAASGSIDDALGFLNAQRSARR